MVSWLTTLDRHQLVPVLYIFACVIFLGLFRFLFRLNAFKVRGMFRPRNLLAATVGVLIALLPWFLHDTGHWQCCTAALIGGLVARWIVRSGPTTRPRK